MAVEGFGVMAVEPAEDWREELRRTIHEALQVTASEVAVRVRRDVREELLKAFRTAPPQAVLQRSYTKDREDGFPSPEGSNSEVSREATRRTLDKTRSFKSKGSASSRTLETIESPTSGPRRQTSPSGTQVEFAKLVASGDLALDAKSPQKEDEDKRPRSAATNVLDMFDRVASEDDLWTDSSTRGYMASKAIKNYPLQDEVLIKRTVSKRHSNKEGSPMTAVRTSKSSRFSLRSMKSNQTSVVQVLPNGQQSETPRSRSNSVCSSASDDPNLLFMDRFAVTHMATAAPSRSEPSRANEFIAELKMEGHTHSKSTRTTESSGLKLERMESVMPGLTKAMPRAVTTLVSRTSRDASRCYIAVAGFVMNPLFDSIISVLLLANAASIGAQVDYMARNQATRVPILFVVLGWFFVISFTLEICLRLFVHGRRFFYMPGWQWNVFDVVVVMLQLVEEIMATVVDTLLGELYANFTVARLLRSVRLVRVVRFVRIVRLIRELRCMVASIAGSLRTFLWTIALLLLMIYIIGVYITQVVVDHIVSHREEENLNALLTRYYGSLGDSVLSLFQALSGGIDWDDLVHPLRSAISPLMAVAFSIYIAFAMFVMLNLVTGIFVESAHANIKEDKDLDLVNRVRELFITADDDRSGCITWEEFKKHVGSPHMEEYFRSIDLDLSEAKSFFSLLDIDGTGRITSEDFLNGCLRLRGTARAIDLTTLVHNMKRMYKQWLNSSKRIERHMTFLSRSLANLLDDSSLALQRPSELGSLLPSS